MQQLVILLVHKLCAHSAHSFSPDSPTSQQLQQDRKPQAVKSILTSWWWA